MQYYNKNHEYLSNNVRIMTGPQASYLDKRNPQEAFKDNGKVKQMELISENEYVFPLNLADALILIKNAVTGELDDEKFYNALIELAPSTEDKQIIMDIRDDERKHNKMFRQLYYELTKNVLPEDSDDSMSEIPQSYSEGLQKALFGELGAVERYRKILYAMQNRKHLNMIIDILTDELKHADKYNFLIHRNTTE